MFKSEKSDSALPKIPLTIGVVIVSIVVILVVWIAGAFILESFWGDDYIPSHDGRAKNIKEYYETNCKLTKREGDMDPLSSGPQTWTYSCEIKIDEPIYYFCYARAITDRCFWRSGFLVLDKLMRGNLFIPSLASKNRGCINTNFNYDVSAFRGNQITFQEGCNDFTYYSLTAIKDGKYSVTFTGKYDNETAVLNISVPK